MYRKTFVKIDNNQIVKNIKEITNKYNDYKYYIGVVKGNAYGHGDYIVNDLIKGGVNYLAVSSLEEGISIRKYNKDIPILVLEPISLEYLSVVIENKITLTVSSLDYVRELCLKKISSKLNVHIKLDTGMNRLGFKNEDDLLETVDLIYKNKMINLEGIYTHIGTSGLNDSYYDKSISKFRELTKDIDLKKIPIVHLNRSITLVHHKKYDFETGVRLGIIMYGFSQSIKEPIGLRKLKRNIMLKVRNISDCILENDLKIKTCFSLYSEVISVHRVLKGEYVGYGANYIAKADKYVACVPIGYFDGMNKSFRYVYINGKLCKIVGDVCMDMTLVEVDSSVKIGDKVEIIGKNISVSGVCNRTGINAYHLFTSISNRVPRVYDNDVEIKY